MKVICTVSHEQSLQKGGFKRYEAGKQYDTEKEGLDVDDLGPNFSPVEKRKTRKSEVTEDEH